MSVSDLLCLSVSEMSSITQRAGMNAAAQETLMRALLGPSVTLPQRELESKTPQIASLQHAAKPKEHLRVRMEAQKLRIQNDRSEPLTAEQRATLHPEVQRM
jgi:hypothetical protein